MKLTRDKFLDNYRIQFGLLFINKDNNLFLPLLWQYSLMQMDTKSVNIRKHCPASRI